MPEPSPAVSEYLRGLGRALGPDIVGAPVDAAEQLVNLLRAGYGYLGHKAGMLTPEQMPAVLENSPGTSGWWAQKTNVPDTGTAAYSAGRLTPVGLALAKAAAPATKKLLDAAVANAAQPRAAGMAEGQRGAIRVGGDESLMPYHTTSAEGLEKVITKNGRIELYSPSIGIARNRVPSDFGNVLLIPKVGAFDPATSPSTLFNRDAYTARWGQYQGKAASAAAKPTLALPGFSGSVEIAKRLALNDPEILGQLRTASGEAFHLNENAQKTLENLQKLSRKDLEKVISGYESGKSASAALIDELGGWDKITLPHWEEIGRLDAATSDFRTVLDSILHKAYKISAQPDFRKEAATRLRERLFHGIRGEDLRLNEGTDLGVVSSTGSFLHDLSIKSSPAFRSFKSFESHPLGARLLKGPEGIGQQPEWQLKAINKAFGGNAWIGNSAMKKLAEKATGSYEYFKNTSEVRESLEKAYSANGFNLSEAPEQEIRDFYKAAQTARALLKRTPSDYAELKVQGPVQVNPENFAGVIIRNGDAPGPDLDYALYNSGLSPHMLYGDQEAAFELAKELQRRAGPARKQPLR